MLSTCPRGSNFGPLRSTTSCFSDSRWSKIGKLRSAANDLGMMTLNTEQSSQRYPVYTKILIPDGPIFVYFAVQLAVFKMQGCWKSEISEMYWLILDWSWILNGQGYPVYTKFPCTTRRFKDTTLPKIRKIQCAPTDLKLTLGT